MRNYVTQAGAFGLVFAMQHVGSECWPHNGQRDIYCEMRAWKRPDRNSPDGSFVFAEWMVSFRGRLKPSALSAGSFGRMTLLSEGCTARRRAGLAQRIDIIMVEFSFAEEEEEF